MKQRISFSTAALLILFSLLFFYASAEAVPSLGVASGGDWLDRVINEQHAFILEDGQLFIWFGRNSGLSAEDFDLHIYLVTNSASAETFTFNGDSFAHDESPKQADGYHRVGADLEYYYVDLGTVGELDSDWIPADEFVFPDIDGDNPFLGGNKEFYFFTGTGNFTGFSEDEWLFAIADHNTVGSFFDRKDEFSPQTTSTTIPEPSTLVLLGSGLLGLGLFARRKFKKS